MGSQPLTIVQLAVKLGLSKTTVADALHGSGRVSDATRKRVQAAAHEFGYVANRAAQQLRTNTSKSVGLYISPDIRNMPFYMPFAFGAADQAASLDHDLTLLAGGASSEAFAATLAGAIVVDVLPGDRIAGSLLESGLPVVSAGRLSGEEGKRVRGVVEIDYVGLCERVLDGLSAHSAKRPALVIPEARDAFSWVQLLQDGYRKWCARHNIAPVIEILSPFPSTDDLGAALGRTVGNGAADSLFFGWEALAERAAVLLTAGGYRIGVDVQLATLSSDSKDQRHDSYTAVLDLRPRAFGARAIRTLAQLINQPDEATLFERHDAVVWTRTS